MGSWAGSSDVLVEKEEVDLSMVEEARSRSAILAADDAETVLGVEEVCKGVVYVIGKTKPEERAAKPSIVVSNSGNVALLLLLLGVADGLLVRLLQWTDMVCCLLMRQRLKWVVFLTGSREKPIGYLVELEKPSWGFLW